MSTTSTSTERATRPTVPVRGEPAYKVAEVAAFLRVDKAAVYDLVKTGALRHVRIGRLIRVPESALADFLAGDSPYRAERLA